MAVDRVRNNTSESAKFRRVWLKALIAVVVIAGSARIIWLQSVRHPRHILDRVCMINEWEDAKKFVLANAKEIEQTIQDALAGRILLPLSYKSDLPAFSTPTQNFARESSRVIIVRASAGVLHGELWYFVILDADWLGSPFPFLGGGFCDVIIVNPRLLFARLLS